MSEPTQYRPLGGRITVNLLPRTARQISELAKLHAGKSKTDIISEALSEMMRREFPWFGGSQDDELLLVVDGQSSG